MQTRTSHPSAQPFWDRIAPKYAQKPIGDPGAYEEKLAQVGSLLRATDRVLDSAACEPLSSRKTAQ